MVRLGLLLASAGACGMLVGQALADDTAVDFLRDVKPILAQRCYKCHSSLKEESNFRLDSVAALIKGGDFGAAVVPGNSSESRLIEAVERRGDLKMPPEGEPLTPAQIAKLKAWIDAGAHPPAEGAETKVTHWSFVKPVRPEVPKPSDPAWGENPIDAFVAAKHAELGLVPVGEAPPNLLLRRLYLDLTGLPPPTDELEKFLSVAPSLRPSVAPAAPDGETERRRDGEKAYAAAVDKLLASPEYGERWGRHWMDVWRYSDWDGYGNEIRESKPHIWRWRDWIVESLNSDMPYDRMVQEMLAADELAPEDPDALRATGYLVRSWYKFNRHKWMDDAIEHTGKAFLGVTFNCCRCHDHMYDPLAQTEYYQLRAIFEPYDIRTDRVPGEANVETSGLVRVFDAKSDAQTFVFVRGNDKEPLKDQPLSPAVPKVFAGVPFAVEPVSLGPTAYYQGLVNFVREESRAAAKAAIAKARADVAKAEQALSAAKQKEAQVAAKPAAAAPSAPPPAAEHVLDDDFTDGGKAWTIGPGVWEFKDGRVVQSDPRDELCPITTKEPHPKDFVATLRFKTTGGDTYKSVGIAFDARGTTDLQAVYLSAHSPGPHLWVRTAGQESYPTSGPKVTPVELGRETELKLAVRGMLANVWVDGKLVLAYKLPAERAEGGLILWTYDATAEFLHATIDRLAADVPLAEATDGSAATAEALTAAVGDAEKGLAIALKSVVASESDMSSLEARLAADEANYAAPPPANAKELSLVASAFERHHAALAAEVALQAAQLKAAQAKRAVKAGDDKTTKAAAEADKAVEAAQKALEAAHKATTVVTDNYTRLTPVHPATSTGRRLALARWITARDNPLAARVAINHIWLRHFGSPLVPSVFDFGLNGKPPTNQPLLDWLAVELMENGWRMKHIHRLIVTSRTYQLASSAGMTNDQAPMTKQIQNPKSKIQNASIDAENLYYWRANARRLEAEAVRDATLFVAGSLDLTRGGPDLDQTSGLTVPRRSIYFRSSKEKKMEFLSLFDSANPVECYRRSESIAPQQALAMANSTLTLAQSRLLAKKLSDSLTRIDPAEVPRQFVAQAFVRILCRQPSEAELATCLEFLSEQATRLSDPKSLTAFSAGPAASVPPSGDPAQRARENLVHVLLNHNDFVTVR